MARKQSGGFNKFLNFIGLVDDDQPRNSYADEYDSGSYGRPSTYVPPRNRSVRDDARRQQPVRRSLPEQTRSSYGTARSYGGDEEPRSNRRTVSYEREYSAPRTSTRPRSRFEEPEEPIREEPPERMLARPARSSGADAVMFNLSRIEDANPVINALVMGSTSIITIKTDDAFMRQRIVDTLCGAVFALKATINVVVKDKTYIVAPKNVIIKTAYEVDDRF